VHVNFGEKNRCGLRIEEGVNEKEIFINRQDLLLFRCTNIDEHFVHAAEQPHEFDRSLLSADEIYFFLL